MKRLWLLLFSLVLAASAAAQQIAPVITVDNGPNALVQEQKHYVVLVSLDGFRYDYAKKYGATHLLDLAKHGASAPDGMLPSYPSLTFPNHYTLVTGLYPEHHGIVANDFLDPETGERFRMTDAKTVDESKWWLGEPFWVSLAHRGLRTATMFWVGSTAEIEGVRPTYWRPYVKSTPIADRLEQFFAWLDLPALRRPRFLTLYFENVDEAGHEYGPDAPETHQAVAKVDEAIGELRAGLEKRGVFDRVNLIVVAAHGMAAVNPKRGVKL